MNMVLPGKYSRFVIGIALSVAMIRMCAASTKEYPRAATQSVAKDAREQDSDFAPGQDDTTGLVEPDEALTDSMDTDTVPEADASSTVHLTPIARALTSKVNASREALFKVCADAQYQFTPVVRTAYLAYAKAKAQAGIAAKCKTVPEEFFAWIDRTPDVAGSVYGARTNSANVILMLYSLKLDLGPEKFEKYHQLALAMAIVHESLGPVANITPRAPLKLVVPPCPLKPINTKDQTRTLDTNDHIINFLNDHTIDDGTGRQRSLVAADVMESRALQEDFNAYMKLRGCDVSLDCGDHVIYPKRKKRVTGPSTQGILKAYKMFRGAYIAKGLLPAVADPSPTPAENCLFLIRNAECTTPSKCKKHPPDFPLTSPWPAMTFLAKDMRSLREQDDIWQRYHDHGELHTYGEYIGPIAQQFDFQSARRLCPFPFAYKTVQMMLKDGGVCGTMATIAVRTYKSLGIPASTAGQPGHCALVYFTQDPKTGTYQCKGSQFMRAGPKDTTVLTSWLFGDGGTRKKMVYHQSIAWALDYGFTAYLDSTLAWQVFRVLPDTVRKEHGQELLESGLKLNPYNILLADACVEHAASPQEKLHCWNLFITALDGVTKPGCPTTGLYPETIHGRLVKDLNKLPSATDGPTAQFKKDMAPLREAGKG